VNVWRPVYGERSPQVNVDFRTSILAKYFDILDMYVFQFNIGIFFILLFVKNHVIHNTRQVHAMNV